MPTPEQAMVFDAHFLPIFEATLAGRFQDARLLLRDALQAGGLPLLWGCFWALATAHAQMAPKGPQSGTFLIIDQHTGQAVEPEVAIDVQGPIGVGRVAGMRVIACATNGLPDDAWTIFETITSLPGGDALTAGDEFTDVLLESLHGLVCTGKHS